MTAGHYAKWQATQWIPRYAPAEPVRTRCIIAVTYEAARVDEAAPCRRRQWAVAVPLR